MRLSEIRLHLAASKPILRRIWKRPVRRSFAHWMGIVPLLVLLLASLACNFPKLRAPEKARQLPGITPAAEIAALPHDGTVLSQAEGGPALVLSWRGDLPVEPGKCHTLQVWENQQAVFGGCGEPPVQVAFNPPQWDEIHSYFAPFDGEVEGAQMAFYGRGAAAGPAWQRALLNWTRLAANALHTGRACSACSTVLAWSFGETLPGSGSCSQLWVTDYGYAYSGLVDCRGGQADIISQGWLETDEWVELDAWVSSRAEVHLGEDGASYLLGNGQQGMDAVEIEKLSAWAHAVQSRLMSTAYNIQR